MKVAIYGLGLIGGSVGMGLIESGFAEAVYGWDPNANTLDEALKRTAIHTIASKPSLAVDVDYWFIATPPSAVQRNLELIAPYVKPTACVMDCTSVKQPICEVVPDSIKKHFVGGHPMRGREVQGIEHASADLFTDCKWVLCPLDETQTRSLSLAEKAVYALDADPIVMDAAEHDQQVTLLSHIPTLLANALLHQSKSLTGVDISAGSWADLTRVGGSNPELWSQIFSANSSLICESLEGFISELAKLKSELEKNDAESGARIQKYIEQAAQIRRSQIRSRSIK